MSHGPYYCTNCREKYFSTQEKLTPGFCSSQCRDTEASRKSQPSFQEQQRSRYFQTISKKFVSEEAAKIRPPKLSDQAVVREQKCECCGIIEYNGKPLKFELCHLDGNVLNDNPPNLKLFCPNCKSQHENMLK